MDRHQASRSTGTAVGPLRWLAKVVRCPAHDLTLAGCPGAVDAAYRALRLSMGTS